MEENKITLTLENFRCWPKLNLEFEANEIILLKGDNGSGKSTILHSFSWILYGKPKNVAPRLKPKSKTRGSLDFGTFIVERQTSPNLVKIIVENKMYDGDVAQSIINEKFGCFEVWVASCYVLQDCRNSFLSVPNKDKINLLNKIAFSADDPLEFINKVDFFITDCGKEYDIFCKNYENSKNIFDNKWKDIDFSEIVEAEEIEKLNLEILSLKDEKRKFHDLQSVRKAKLEEIFKLDDEINKREKNKDNLPENLTLFGEEINFVDTEQLLSDLSEFIPQAKKLEEIKSKTSKIEDCEFDKSILEDKREELLEIYRDESIYDINKSLAKSLQVAYDYQSVEDKMNELVDIVDSQPLLNLEKKIKEHENELKNIKIVYPIDPNPKGIATDFIESEKPDITNFTDKISILQNNLNENSTKKGILEQKITELLSKIERSKTAIPCPHCKKYVKYTGGKIVPFEEPDTDSLSELVLDSKKELNLLNNSITNDKESIKFLKSEEVKIIKDWEILNKNIRIEKEELSKKIHKYQIDLEKINVAEDNRIKLSEKIEKLKNDQSKMECNFANKKIISQRDIEDNNARISKMEQIVFIEILKPSSLIKKEIERMELQLEKSKLLAQLDLIKIPIKYSSTSYVELSEIKVKVQNWIKEYQNKFNIIKNNEKRLLELLETKKSIILPEEQSGNIIDIENKMNEIRSSIELNQIKINANEDYIKLLELRNQVDSRISDLADLKTIKKYSIDTKCESLDKIAEEINLYIDEICSNFFDEPISIEILMNKKLKSGDTTQKVNLSIDYRGFKNQDFEDFSGGEKTKMSLALTIALNNMSTCPFLLLDEIYGPLKPELREEVTKTIKNHSLYKTIICISHDNFNDAYDNVIDLDTFPSKSEIKKNNEIKKSGPISRVIRPAKKIV